MIDEINLEILNILQENARITNADIARKLGMAPSAILERMRKLEAAGVIENYETRLNGQALGLELTAFIFIKLADPRDEHGAGRLLAGFPEIQEVHYIAGEDCLLAKVRVPNTHYLFRLLKEKIAHIGAVVSTRTTVVLKTVKESATLPLESLLQPASSPEIEEIPNV
jgi:Lrp/AsnC family leucine-responsive transcriptional regulator